MENARSISSVSAWANNHATISKHDHPGMQHAKRIKIFSSPRQVPWLREQNCLDWKKRLKKINCDRIGSLGDYWSSLGMAWYAWGMGCGGSPHTGKTFGSQSSKTFAWPKFFRNYVGRSSRDLDKQPIQPAGSTTKQGPRIISRTRWNLQVASLSIRSHEGEGRDWHGTLSGAAS